MIDKESDIDLAELGSLKNQSDCFSDCLGFKNMVKSSFISPHAINLEL